MASPPPLALVTGGCRRLGAAIAARLAEAGCALALHSAHEHDPEPVLVERVRAAGVPWERFVADFAEPGAADALFDAVVARFGRAPELIVNSASVFGQDRFGASDEAAMLEAYRINTIAPARLMQRIERGAVVNILDQRIAQPHGDQFAYSLSKMALAGATAIAARALAPRVRVNAVAPGLTLPTPDYDADQLARVAARMPLERLPAPEEIAEAVLYLAQAKSVTGQTIFVDAGARFVSFGGDFVNV